MTDKVVLNNALGTYDVTQINANFAIIEDVLNEKVLFRDNPSNTPNGMNNAIDMSSNRIINLPAPVAAHEPARKADIVPMDVVNAALDRAEAAAESAENTLESVQSAVTDIDNDAMLAANSAAIASNSALAAQDAKNVAVNASVTSVNASTTATSKANEASASAATATTKAGEAQAAATTATSAATTATNKATEAADSATAAQNYANQAASVALNSDWNETNTSSLAFIKNKPTIPSTTTQISEGTNLYYTAGRVLITPLSGLSTATSTVVTASDTLLAGVGKLQAQINTQATSIAGKEPAISTSTATYFWRGNKTFSALSSSDVTTALGFTPISSSGSITGNAATATKLQTARMINGVAFDGTADITISGGGGSAATADKLTTARTLSITGDVTWTSPLFDGSANVTAVGTLANSGVTAGTYNNASTSVTPITVDAKGRVTGTGVAVTITPAWGSITSKPTTLSGYGITDAASSTHNHTGVYQPIDADLTAIAALAGTSGLLKKTAADTWTLDTSTYLTVSDITDNVTSTATNKALSANQGKLLNDQIGNIATALTAIIG